MKIIHIFLMLCLTSTINHHCMDTEQSFLWCFLPEEIITHIVAYSDLPTKAALYETNHQLLCIACKNNIPNMLEHIPCIISRQDHINYMVKYAKEDNIDMVQKLIKITTCCNHADWFDVIPYFLPKDSPDLFLLQKYTAHFNENLMEIFLPHIMTAYKGDTNAINQYKINYGKVPSYGYYDDTTIHIQRISHVNVAIAKNHPISLVQLMLAQNPDLLNAKDICWSRTPLMMAINSNNIPMCKLLLSYKNINLATSTYLGTDVIAYAQRLNRDQIITLLIDYDNTHP